MKDDELPRPPQVAATADTPRDVEQLRREAEDARAELADSLHELRTRLSPSEVLAHTKTSVQNLTEQATASVAAQVKRGAEDLRQQVALRSQQAVQAVQDRPAAVAATTAAAAGLFWFLSRDKHRNGHRSMDARAVSARGRRYRREAPLPPPPAGEVPGHLPTSARAPAPFDPSDSAPHDDKGVVNEQVGNRHGAVGSWRHARPGPWTAGAAAAIVTTAMMARRSSSNQARQSGVHAQASWERAQAAAREGIEHASGRAQDVTQRIQRAVGRLAQGSSSLESGPAAAIGTVIGIAAALLMPRTAREVEVSRQVQRSLKRSFSSGTRRLAEQARSSLLPTLAELLGTSPTRTRGQ